METTRRLDGSPAGSSADSERGLKSGSPSLRDRIRLWVKRLLFPGLDLHTRCRYRFLTRYLRAGAIDTLDAGCGNGALSYAAYRLGNRVLGVTMESSQVQKAKEYFSFLRTEPSRLRFETRNLYDLPQIHQKFDQIICSETLEHISRDGQVMQYFCDMLREGGVLHLCCPYSEHPGNRGRVCADESVGWHVRDGYTLESYRSLVEPLGLQIVKSAGFGSPLLVWMANAIQPFISRDNYPVAFFLFFLTWPLQLLDYENPKVPFSLYVQCVKTPRGATGSGAGIG